MNMRKTLTILMALALLLSTVTALVANTDKATVKEVQAALNEAGYNCGTPDGIAGNMTASAISAYQKDKGLEVTGTITDELLSSLFPAEEAAGTETTEAEPVAEMVEDLYDPDIFNATWYANLVERAKAAAGQAHAAEAAKAAQEYQLGTFGISQVDTLEGFFAYIGSMGLMGYWCVYEDDGYDNYAPPVGMILEIDVSDGKKVDRVRYEAMAAFVELAGGIYGGTEEELASLITMLGEVPAWGDEASLGAEWEEPRVASFGTGAVCFECYSSIYLCVSAQDRTLDWATEYNVSFGGPKDEPEDGSEEHKPDYEEDGFRAYFNENVPRLPAEVVNATGGIPDSLEGIPEKYDLTEAIAYCQQIKLLDALKSLEENGSYEFPLPAGWVPETEDFIRGGVRGYNDEEPEDMDLEVIVSTDKMTVTLRKPFPEHVTNMGLIFDYSEDMYFYALYSEDYGEEHEEYSFYDVVISDDIEIDPATGSECSYALFYEWINGDIDVEIEIYIEDEKGYRRWEAHYDLDTGERYDLLCEEFIY